MNDRRYGCCQSEVGRVVGYCIWTCRVDKKGYGAGGRSNYGMPHMGNCHFLCRPAKCCTRKWGLSEQSGKGLRHDVRCRSDQLTTFHRDGSLGRSYLVKEVNDFFYVDTGSLLELFGFPDPDCSYSIPAETP